MRLILKTTSNNKESLALAINKVCTIDCAACIRAKTATKVQYSGIYINRILYCSKYKYFIYSRLFVRSYIHKITLFISALPYKVLI